MWDESIKLVGGLLAASDLSFCLVAGVGSSRIVSLPEMSKKREKWC